MNITGQYNVQTLIKELLNHIDELIQCQRDEQKLILSRNAAGLPSICAKITSLTNFVQQKQAMLKKIVHSLGGVPDECKSDQLECVQKFKLLQELALQNHLLLENSLEFLQEVFQQILGVSESTCVYNSMGMMPNPLGLSGNVLDVKV